MKKNHEKLLALTTAVIIIAVVLFSAIIDPQLKKHQQHLHDLNQLELKLTKLRGDILVKDRIDRSYAQIEPLLAIGQNDQQEISNFTQEVSNLYSKLNIKIRSVKILPPANESFYRSLAIKIEMSANIKDILKFIHAVEIHPSPLRIEQLDIKAQEINDTVQASFLISKVIAESKNVNENSKNKH
jgi:Tfp pilus assembly protein PilO